MTTGGSIKIDMSIENVLGLSAVTIKMLLRDDIKTVGDLITQFPSRYEDRQRMEFKGFTPSIEPVCHHVRIVKARTVRFGRRSGFFEADTEAANDNPLHQQLTLRWFNMPFMNRVIAVDMEMIVYGKIKEIKGRLIMGHPEYEIVRGDDDDADAVQIHTGRIVPVYRLRGGLKQKPLRAAVWHALQNFDFTSVADLLPTPKSNGEFAGMSRGLALRHVHFPEGQDTLALARRYLALEEFHILQLRVLRRRLRWRSNESWPERAVDHKLMREFIGSLPFKFTPAQVRCLDEICCDMASTQPMNRLLHGDVGSGKTVVALAAMLQAVEAGHQAALMAPTQILAEQLYANARRWLEPLGIRVSLRTGAKNIDAIEMPQLFADMERTRPRVPQAAPSRLAPGTTPDAHYHRRRLPHFERPWAIYHITTSTLNRRELTPAERDIILHHVIEAHHLKQIELLAVCVMPDHLHILCEPQPKSRDAEGSPEFWSLGEIMSGIKSVSARRINKMNETRGSIWEKECFDTMVRGDEDLQGRFLYIMRNPKEAGLVGDDEEYRWLWTRDDEGRQETIEEQSARAQTAAREGACAPKLSDQEPQVLIGTHALLYDAAALPRLGIAVIDEQHKFGVAQRTRLIARGHAPHVLVMTATPIPRTLSLTLYGDLDVSTIDEKPSQRGGIITSVRPQKKLVEITKFLVGQIEAGRQAYIVYPLIDESEKLKADAATIGFEEWTARLKPHAVGLLHGRMDAAAKDDVMRRFRAGEIKALVCTTVIEVGVDVPNATVMIIFNAERFGLAQLHQLRGRVGRGEHESHCILLIPDKDEEAKERLKILEETSDGFRIAEEDLRRRGPGDLLGSAQSGQAPLRFAELLGDTRLLTTARRLAERTLAADPELNQPKHAELKKLVGEDEAPAATMQ